MRTFSHSLPTIIQNYQELVKTIRALFYIFYSSPIKTFSFRPHVFNVTFDKPLLNHRPVLIFIHSKIRNGFENITHTVTTIQCVTIFTFPWSSHPNPMGNCSKGIINLFFTRSRILKKVSVLLFVKSTDD